MPIIPIPPEFSQFEPTAKGTRVKGVFVGGCVNRGDGSSFRAKAHAHARAGIENCGWICVRSHRRVRNKVTGQLTRTMWHEYAHIMTGEGHTDAWRKYMHDVLHQPVPARYKKRRRLVIPHHCHRTTSYGYQCRKWAGGVQHFCPRCLNIYEKLYPQGWRSYPGDVCEHGTYVGGCGADYMCAACEME